MSAYQFRLGHTYQSKTHGKVRYMGEDDYMGEITEKFLALDVPERPYIFIKPTVLEHHFENQAKQQAKEGGK